MGQLRFRRIRYKESLWSMTRRSSIDGYSRDSNSAFLDLNSSSERIPF